jgi:hypothetical protein
MCVVNYGIERSGYNRLLWNGMGFIDWCEISGCNRMWCETEWV